MFGFSCGREGEGQRHGEHPHERQQGARGAHGSRDRGAAAAAAAVPQQTGGGGVLAEGWAAAGSVPEEGQFSQDVHPVLRQTLMCAELGRVRPSLQRWLPGGGERFLAWTDVR